MTRRLEIVHLRLAGACPEGLVSDVRAAVRDDGTLESLRIYHHERVVDDLAVHLHLVMAERAAPPSDLGVRLAEALRDHGMVEHTVWTEAPHEDAR